jgi:hypothetical protein
MALKDNSLKIFNFVKDNDGKNFTAQDIADAIGLPVKSVNGSITAAFQRHKDADGNPEPLMERIPAEVENADGTHRQVKLIRLTEAGKKFDPTI